MDRETFAELRALLRPLQRKIQLVASRLVVDRANDSLGMQGVQASALDEEVVEPEHMQPGGLTHVPLDGAEGVLLSIGGVRDDAVAIVISDRRYRPKGLVAGETALYNESPGLQTVITIKATGDVEVALAAGAKLKVAGDTDAPALASKLDSLLAVIAAWVPANTVADAAALQTAIGAAFPDVTGDVGPHLGLTTTGSTKITTGD